MSSDRWLLSFHPDKCKVLRLGYRRDDPYNYKLDHTLKHVQSEKKLGVIIDSKLKFSEHINDKVNKANSIMGIIHSSFRYLDSSTL